MTTPANENTPPDELADRYADEIRREWRRFMDEYGAHTSGIDAAFIVGGEVAARAARLVPHNPTDETGVRIALVRRAAEGRREYATGLREDETNPALREARAVLLAQAAALESAATIMEGDNGPLYGLLPSWRWTDEMEQAVLASRPAPEACDSTADETRKLTVTGPDHHGYYYADCPCGWRSVRTDVAEVACEWSDHACDPASSVRDTAETTGCAK